MGTVYCARLPIWTTKKALRDLFSPYGEIECIWITSSTLAFVCFADKGCAKNAIDSLNNTKFEGRKLIVKWATSECHRRHAGEKPKRSPSASLYVFNFDENHTTERDLLRYFEQYGKVVNVRILGDSAFVNFVSEQYATVALENTHNRNFRGKLLCVDYSSGPSLRSPPQPRRESPDYNRYDFPSSYSSAWRSPPQPRHWIPDDNRYHFPPSYSTALRSPPQQRGWSPEYNRYDLPPSYSWWARISRSPVYNRNDRLSYSRASSSVHRRYPSRSNGSGSRD